MDSHFEVILDRIKSLTQKSGRTVWFEIPEVLTSKSVLVIINDKNNIGMVTLEYQDAPILNSYKLTKHTYDKLMDCNYSSQSIADHAGKVTDTGSVIKWVVN